MLFQYAQPIRFMLEYAGEAYEEKRYVVETAKTPDGKTNSTIVRLLAW